MITRQQLEQLIHSVVSALKRRRREEAAFGIAALSFSAAFALGLPRFPEFSDGIDWKETLQLSIYVVGAFSLGYGVIRVWRLVYPPELQPTKDRPSAIRGPMAFTEADGELFRKLGRESELQRLLGLVLDEQNLMIVVRGASGAGKTSLLRAGLKHILGDRVIFHYWEAVPMAPEQGLLRALQEKWPEDKTRPATLDELINPVDVLGRQSHVIILDQFEQLRGNKEIFQLLCRILSESKPPHRITWIIAFRREFSADWMDFLIPELERGIRPPQDVSLLLFTAENAKDVIGQLINESNLKDSIEQSVINNLVQAATVDGRVSPVDIGIGLLVLAELHEQRTNQTLTKRDYQFGGGAEGLLTQYIIRCLELFPREHQNAILKAMLALRDPEDPKQRLAEGATISELAVEAGIDRRLLKTYLNRLTDRDIRLLEAYTAAGSSEIRYRLPHERLIPALYRLTGKILAAADQAKVKFENAFQAWKTNGKHWRYLMKARELRLIKRYETKIPWGNEEKEKRTFLYRSVGHCRFKRTCIGGAVMVLVIAGWILNIQYQRFEHERYLSESGYPSELYDWQPQLKKLGLIEYLDLDRFKWLSSNSVEELELHVLASSNSLSGLTSLSKCQRLEKLTLDLTDSQVSDLKPLEQLKGLKQLTLNLRASQVSDLKPLEQLKGLTQLTLDLSSSPVTDFNPLKQLAELKQLTLNLSSTDLDDLQPLDQLKGLSQLSLDLDNTKVSDLKPLEHMKELSQLSLSLGSSPVNDLTPLAQLTGLKQLSLSLGRSKVSDLSPLEQLQELSQLTLDLSYTDLSDLQPLGQLKGLSQLSLNVRASKVTDLKPLEQLTTLSQLTLDLRDTEVSDLESLDQFKGPTLTLDLRDSQVSDLKPLEQLTSLTELTLNLGNGSVRDLKPLEQLKGISQLSLDLSTSPVSDLKPLGQLKELSKLSLSVSEQVKDLKNLEHLKSLTQLSLDLSQSKVNDLKPLEQLTGLSQLSLDLSRTQVKDLKPLEQLTRLTQLSLQLRGKKGVISKVRDLQILATLPQLQSLSLQSATEQRKSLRSIPASLAELKF